MTQGRELGRQTDQSPERKLLQILRVPLLLSDRNDAAFRERYRRSTAIHIARPQVLQGELAEIAG